MALFWCLVLERKPRTFPGGPEIRIWHFHCRRYGGTGSILGLGPKIPQASERYQKKPKTLFLYALENNTCFYER